MRAHTARGNERSAAGPAWARRGPGVRNAKGAAFAAAFRAAALAAALLGLSAAAAGAQEVQIVTDEDALFGSADAAPPDGTETQGGSSGGIATSQDGSAAGSSDDALFQDDGIEEVQSGTAAKAVSTFLKTESVRISGTFTGTVDAGWTWDDPWHDGFDPVGPDSSALDPTVGTKLLFDARPTEDYRVYGSIKTYWPYGATYNYLTSATYETSPTTYVATDSESVYVPAVKVFELFADFSWNDALYFRFGKHTVKWGVGYFWSPADVINLTAIDPLNPEEQREGPASLRLLYSVPNTQTNLWAYAIIPDLEDLSPEDVAGAGKIEFLLGDWEIGTGAYYRYGYAPRAMLTATGSIGKIALFGEGSFSWGSDKTFVTGVSVSALASGFLTTEERTDEPFFSGTGGFSYTNSDIDLTIVGQYYYNGDTYSDAERRDLIAEAKAALPAIQATLGEDSSSADSLLAGLLVGTGRHYAALSVSKTELFTEDLSASVVALANLSDLSGLVKPTLSWEPFSKMTLSAGATFYWSTDALWGAGDDGEYVVLAGGPAVTLTLSASLGAGSF